MFVLFMRHLESEKNINKTFSSVHDEEPLTNNGKRMGQEIADVVETFIKCQSLNINSIYCANSNRAISTGQFLADKLNITLKAYDDLRSNNSGELIGKTEDEATKLNPTFVKQLELFRAGLYSSYNFIKVYDREDKYVFEKRVNNCISSILSDTSESLKIFILHHSSITAALIDFARKFYHYPNDFYGHVSCDIGHIYLLYNNEIVLCNEPFIKLSEINKERVTEFIYN